MSDTPRCTEIATRLSEHQRMGRRPTLIRISSSAVSQVFHEAPPYPKEDGTMPDPPTTIWGIPFEEIPDVEIVSEPADGDTHQHG